MGTAILDTCSFTKIMKRSGWWADVRRDIETGKYYLATCQCEKYKQEVEHSKDVADWFEEMWRNGRTRPIDKDEVERLQTIISSLSVCDCPQCNDPHLISMSYVGKISYIFTVEKKLAECRDSMKKSNDAIKYTKFKTLRTKSSYKDNRHRIITS